MDAKAHEVDAVTVTYGERLHLLRKTLSAAFACGIGQIFIIDNGTTPEVQIGLSELAAEFGTERVHVYRLEENLGSAGGFSTGLSIAAKESLADFLWLLDDDTVAEQDALIRLVETWRLMGGKKQTALLSYRNDRRAYRKVVQRHHLHHIEPNAFFDFNLAHLWNGGKKRARQKHGCFELGVAAYGGFFFARKQLDKLALPPAEYFLYFDDYWFTRQFPQRGGDIWLVPSSRLHDAETPWQADRKTVHPWMSPQSSGMRVYHTIRNRLWLEASGITSPLLYRINIFLYVIIHVFGRYTSFYLRNVRRVRQFYQRVGLIRKAFREGMRFDTRADRARR